MKKINKLSEKIFVAIFLITLFSSGISNAQQTAPQACDPDYWKQLEARAWLEAEREIMQNQNLIFKPDSVLEYTCFDQFLSASAWEAGDIFTHTSYFSPPPLQRGTNYAMEKALDNVVFKAMETYISRNFDPWDMLSGRIASLDNSGTENHEFKTPLQKQSYECEVMKNVWKAAKCHNFIHSETFEPTDGFFPFKTIEGFNGSESVDGYNVYQDIRDWPAQLECSEWPTGQFDWEPTRGVSKNEPEAYQFQTPLGQMYQQVRLKLEPGNCEQGSIQTGITVKLSPGAGGGGHPDGICTNPGCVWQEGGRCG